MFIAAPTPGSSGWNEMMKAEYLGIKEKEENNREAPGLKSPASLLICLFLLFLKTGGKFKYSFSKSSVEARVFRLA